MTDSLYFDNHSATKPFPEVLEKFFRYSKEYWGSMSSPHFLGQQQLYPLQKSIETLFQEIGAGDQDEVFFSASSEQAVWQVFFSTYLQISRESGKTLFITSEAKDTSTCGVLEQLKDLGCSVKELPLNAKGQVTRSALESAITPRTALFSIPWACGLTGVIQPISDLAEVCKEKNVLFHVDGSAIVGKSFFRFQDLGVHFFTLDGSVMHAPKGICATFISKDSPLISFSQKTDESVAHISAFSFAVELLQARFEHYCMEMVRLRDRLEQGICLECPGALILFKDSDRLPHYTVISFPSIVSESLLYVLNSRGVYASCGGGKFQVLSQILLKTGLSIEIANSAVSFSLSYDVTQEEIDRTVKIVSQCVQFLQTCSREVF